MRKQTIILAGMAWIYSSAVLADSIPISLRGEKPTQLVRVELNRLQRMDSCLTMDMNIDLTGVHLIPDCTVYLYPWLRAANDSLLLPPVRLNAPQSDLMYRRRRALGIAKGALPYATLREGDHQLPRVNYRKTDIPYQSWMDSATVVVRDEPCDCDARLVPFAIEVVKISPLIVERTDTLIIRDTIRVDRPVVAALPVVPVKKKETVVQHAGYRADIYFPVSGMRILPEHDLNRTAWYTFVSEIDSLRSNNANTVMGITVTGYSSPEGKYGANDIIAKRRALALRKYLETIYDPTLVEIRVEWVAEDWDRLAEQISASDLPEKEKALEIIDKVDIFKGREDRLKLLAGGSAWNYMLREFFPRLRCVSCRIGYLKRIEK